MCGAAQLRTAFFVEGLLVREPRAMKTIEDAICELHDKVRANQIQIIDGTYSTRALRLLLSK